jgi:hypothetical protein
MGREPARSNRLPPLSFLALRRPVRVGIGPTAAEHYSTGPVKVLAGGPHHVERCEESLRLDSLLAVRQVDADSPDGRHWMFPPIREISGRGIAGRSRHRRKLEELLVWSVAVGVGNVVGRSSCRQFSRVVCDRRQE